MAGGSAAPGPGVTGLVGKVLTIATGAALVVVGLMFSLLVLAMAAAGAMLVGVYLWWRTRELRRRARENPPGGRVIEGEVTRDDAR